MKLPYFQSTDRILSMLETQWKAILDPILTNPANSANILPNVSLSTGSNTISHKLGKELTGWQIIRQRAAASVYDTQDLNSRPELTLLLTASAPVSVDLLVF